MSKGSGNTRASSSAKPSSTALSGGVKQVSPKPSVAKVDFGKMPANNASSKVRVGDRELTIRAAPTGYGNQQKRNGRFTIYENGRSIYSETWGDGYSSYTSKAQAWREIKSYITKYIK